MALFPEAREALKVGGTPMDGVGYNAEPLVALLIATQLCTSFVGESNIIGVFNRSSTTVSLHVQQWVAAAMVPGHGVFR